MKTIKVPTHPYDKDDKLFGKSTVLFNTGLTVLVGCNGSGKSTLLTLIKDKFKRDKSVLVMDYNDRVDGGSNLMSKFGFLERFNDLAGMFCSSEGERIYRGVGEFATGMHKRIQQANPKEVWILMDAVGSGLSIDGIQEIKGFANIIMEANPDRDVYFIVSTNEYEFAEGSDCIDVTTFKHRTFKTYNAYRNYVLLTRRKKDKRYSH